jgi:alkylated DNA repair dioxygenase AlkB
MTADLFDTPLLPGLRFREELIGREDEAALVDELQRLDLAPFRFQGWTGKRMTRSFGWHYDFDGGGLAPAEPLPGWLLPLRVQAAEFAGVAPENLRHALLARYDPDAGIGWHKDRDVFDKVVGVSLNSAATLRFRQRHGNGFRRAELLLPPRSAYLLSGPVRTAWEHRILPGEQLRFSITFRTLSPKGLRLA